MEVDSDDEIVPLDGGVTPAQSSDPNSVLFIEGLPAQVTVEMLTPLFQQSVFFSSLLLNSYNREFCKKREERKLI